MRDQRGSDARSACISCETSGATPLNIRAISAAPTAGQRATITRPAHVQEPPIARPARDDVARDARRFARACCHGVGLRPVSRGNRHFTVGGGRLRQSGPRPEARLLCQPVLEGLTRSARTNSPRQVGRNNFRRSKAAAAARETRRQRRLLGEEGGGG
ncbi:hypothetical protein F511_36134 [Dorcoceras hygrometricum]|uniref:Uncharacterized protein n=1 Tax=Dorcoceras hygrometricum TaxID=472368 RepID=A0A2Z7D022_9LAMI|nr:hypothetical protein F511_36134 [Dorcoceras hygrometricum]